jgi:hypothetical protein
MDDELKRYLDTMMQKMNGGHERILDRLSTLEKDFRDTKDFLVSDSLVASRRRLDLEARVSKLEGKQ